MVIIYLKGFRLLCELNEKSQIFNLWIFMSTEELLYSIPLINVDWIRDWTYWVIKKHISIPSSQNEEIHYSKLRVPK